MSLPDMIFLFVLALVLFGPKKLPEIARTIGKYMNEFKRASNEFKAQIEQEISNLEVENRQTILPPTPLPQGTTSRTLNVVAEASAIVDPVESSAHESATTTAAVEAAVDDEPLFAASTGSSPTEGTSSTSQESHV